MSSTGKVNAALAAAVIFLLLSSCFAYFAFTRMDASQGWVHHTRDVQNALSQFSMANSGASGTEIVVRVPVRKRVAQQFSPPRMQEVKQGKKNHSSGFSTAEAVAKRDEERGDHVGPGL